DAEDLAARHVQVDAAQCVHRALRAAVGLVDVFEKNHKKPVREAVPCPGTPRNRLCRASGVVPPPSAEGASESREAAKRRREVFTIWRSRLRWTSRARRPRSRPAVPGLSPSAW